MTAAKLKPPSALRRLELVTVWQQAQGFSPVSSPQFTHLQRDSLEQIAQESAGQFQNNPGQVSMCKNQSNQVPHRRQSVRCLRANECSSTRLAYIVLLNLDNITSGKREPHSTSEIRSEHSKEAHGARSTDHHLS